MHLKRLRLQLIKQWRYYLLGLIVAAACVFLVLVRLGQTPSGISVSEVASLQASSSLSGIFHDPLNAPYTIIEHFLTDYFPGNLMVLRLTAGLYGLVALGLFYLIMRAWYHRFAAMVGVIVLATSSAWLHIARLATPEILLLTLMGLLVCGIWLTHTKRRDRAVLVSALLSVVALYVPGLVWFILIGIVWQRQSLRYELSRIPLARVISAGLIAAALLTPLGLAIARQPSLAWSFAGLPSQLPKLSQLLSNAWHIPLSILIYSPLNPTHHLGHLPVLNVFEDAMFVLGALAFWLRRHLDRSKLILGGFLISSLLIISGGPVSLAILTPFIYMVVVVGIVYMHDVWLKVFPANPLARSLGLIVLLLAIAISCSYHLREYFIAWPNSATTSAVFNQKLRVISDTIKKTN